MSADRAEQEGEVVDLTARRAYADPDVRTILTQSHDGDFGPVPAPDPAA